MKILQSILHISFFFFTNNPKRRRIIYSETQEHPVHYQICFECFSTVYLKPIGIYMYHNAGDNSRQTFFYLCGFTKYKLQSGFFDSSYGLFYVLFYTISFFFNFKFSPLLSFFKNLQLNVYISFYQHKHDYTFVFKLNLYQHSAFLFFYFFLFLGGGGYINYAVVDLY